MLSTYFVKLPSRGTCAFSLLPSKRTVRGLVDAVAERSCESVSAPLFFGSKALRLAGDARDDASLASLGIEPGFTLEAFVGLKGGAQCGKSVKGRSKEKSGDGDDLASKMRWLYDQALKRIAGKLRHQKVILWRRGVLRVYSLLILDSSRCPSNAATHARSAHACPNAPGNNPSPRRAQGAARALQRRGQPHEEKYDENHDQNEEHDARFVDELELSLPYPRACYLTLRFLCAIATSTHKTRSLRRFVKSSRRSPRCTRRPWPARTGSSRAYWPTTTSPSTSIRYQSHCSLRAPLTAPACVDKTVPFLAARRRRWRTWNTSSG